MHSAKYITSLSEVDTLRGLYSHRHGEGRQQQRHRAAVAAVNHALSKPDGDSGGRAAGGDGTTAIGCAAHDIENPADPAARSPARVSGNAILPEDAASDTSSSTADGISASGGGASGHANGYASKAANGGLPPRPFQRLSKSQTGVAMPSGTAGKADAEGAEVASSSSKGTGGEPEKPSAAGQPDKVTADKAAADSPPRRWNKAWTLNEVAWLRGLMMQVR